MEDAKVRLVRRRPLSLCAALCWLCPGGPRRCDGAGHASGRSPIRKGRTTEVDVGRARRRHTRATSSRVIVILKNQYNAIPATKRRIGTRVRAEKFGNARIMTQVRHAGRRVYRQYHALNAFAAKVSTNERRRLQRDAAVKQVIPDTVVAAAWRRSTRGRATTKAPRARGTPRPTGRRCARATRPSRCSSPRRCRRRTRVR